VSLSIAAASIVAKVVRDRIMARLDVRWPDYGWEKNAGYGTAGASAGAGAGGCNAAPQKDIRHGTAAAGTFENGDGRAVMSGMQKSVPMDLPLDEDPAG
jgi:hypothetical protein